MKSDAMNELLVTVAGNGELPYYFLRDMYVAYGGRHFNMTLRWYADRWPERIIIHRPYNVSESPMIEVTPRAAPS